MNNNALQIFTKDAFTVRTTTDDNGTVWFVARDVAQALEYSEASVNQPNNLFATVPDLWKYHKRIMTQGGEQNMLRLTEQGLYLFLGRSDKKKAQPYQMWIADEVVPSIHKTGAYSIRKEQPVLPSGVLEGARLIFETAGIKDNQLTLALDKVYKSFTGKSALKSGEVNLNAHNAAAQIFSFVFNADMNNNALQVFNYKDNNVRIVEIDGEHWFIAKDICDILELTNSRKAVKSLDDDEKMTVTNSYTHSGQRGGAQMFNVVNEPGLYKLIFKSNKPEAKEFTRWVTHEVLPSIHRSGIYLSDKAAEAYFNDPTLFNAMVQKCSALEKNVAELKKQLDDTHALTILGQVVLAQKGAISFKDAADLLASRGFDIGQNRLFKKCREQKLLYSRKGKQWNRPCKSAIDKGLFNLEISGGFNFLTVITPRGLQYISDLLINDNYPLFILLQKAETE